MKIATSQGICPREENVKVEGRCFSINKGIHIGYSINEYRIEKV